MNTTESEKRHPRDFNAQLEYLDEKIVPSTVQPDLMAGEVATAHASVTSSHNEAAESKIEIRQENRMAKIAERQENALERRERASELKEARAAKIAAAQSSAPAVVGSLVGHLTVTNFGAGGSAHFNAGLSSFGSATGAGDSVTPTVPVTPVTMNPISPSAITPSPPTPSPVLPSPVSASPLPANVSVLLGSVYEAFHNGTLPTTQQPGQPEIQGNNVGIQIHSSDPNDFASMVANAESLGLQVTTLSSDFDIVVGFLPIANLPALAQLAGAPSITPTLAPALL
jgi:hypothetical protein